MPLYHHELKFNDLGYSTSITLIINKQHLANYKLYFLKKKILTGKSHRLHSWSLNDHIIMSMH